MVVVRNRKTVEYIRKREPFRNYTGSFRGEWLGATYVVYSYRTEIGRWREGEGWTLNPERYSVTTSRHQHLLRYAAQ